MKQLENIKLQEITKSDDQIIDQALNTRQEIKRTKTHQASGINSKN